MERSRLRGGRVCALCGRDGGDGQSLAAFSQLRDACVKQQVFLERPDSRYFDPRCALKAQSILRALR